MTELELLKQQTASVYEWTDKLIDTIPFEKWDIVPGVIESSISWQVGHLIVSHYFHSVMVIVGHQGDIMQKMQLKKYAELFTDAFPKYAVGKTDPSELRDHLTIMQQKSIRVIEALSLTELENKLEPTPVPHPIAKTKREAIDWNIKHTMYHCGQVGIIKRIVDQRYDFGLRKEK